MKSDTEIPPLEELIVGESTEVLEPETSDDCRALSLLMAQQALNRVRIVSRNLDAKLFDDEAFVEAIKQLVLKRSSSRVEIIVKDSGPLMRRGHRLVTLAQRLSSYIEIRRPGRQHRTFNAAYFVVDSCAYIDRTFADRYEGTACFNDPRTARAMLSTFDDMWQAGEPDLNLRRLR